MARWGDLDDMDDLDDLDGGDAESMDCGAARELISAALDDEVDPRTIAHLEAHIDGCRGCRRWQSQAGDLRRSLTVAEVRSEPDLTGAILARAGVPDLGAGEWVRALLASVSVVLLLANIPLLVTGSASGADAHVGRHLGAFGVALAIGLGYAAIRPERALGMLPSTAALGVTLFVTAVIDTATGSSSVVGEIRHLLEFGGILALWWISGGRHRLAARLSAIRRPQPGPSYW